MCGSRAGKVRWVGCGLGWRELYKEAGAKGGCAEGMQAGVNAVGMAYEERSGAEMDSKRW